MVVIGELVAGAALGLLFTELFNVVKKLMKTPMEYKTLLDDLKGRLVCLQPLMEQLGTDNTKLMIPEADLKKFETQIQEGILLICQISELKENISKKRKRAWTKQLVKLDRSLKRLCEILKVQTFVTVTKMENVLKKIEQNVVPCAVPQIVVPAVPLTVGLHVQSMLVLTSPLGCRKTTLKTLRRYHLEQIKGASSNSRIQMSATFINLVEINIGYNNSKETLPPELCELTRMKKFSVTNFHKLSSLPEEIGNLINLEVLKVKSCTDLSALPGSVTNLNKLSFLDISGCFSIKELPEHIGDMQSLKDLNISLCKKLHKLPLSVLYLGQLEGVVCDEETKKLWEPFLPFLNYLEIRVPEEKFQQTRSQNNLIVIRMEEKEVMNNMVKSHMSTVKTELQSELESKFKGMTELIRGDIRNLFDDFKAQQKNDQKEEDGTTKMDWEGTNILEPTGVPRGTQLRQFDAWFSNPEAGRHNLEIYDASKEWFVDLMTPGMWLSDSHVNVFLHLVRKKAHPLSQSFYHRCTILDTVFCSWMNGRWEAFQNTPNYEWDSDMVDYPLGKSPKYTQPWSEVDYLYLPINVNNLHWLAVCVNLNRRQLTIYDSMRSARPDDFICGILKPMATMLPSLLLQSGFYALRPELNPITSPFKVVRLADDIPQQFLGGDCGVFMLKYVEYLSLGQSLMTFTQDDMQLFRKRMALDIFAMNGI